MATKLKKKSKTIYSSSLEKDDYKSIPSSYHGNQAKLYPQNTGYFSYFSYHRIKQKVTLIIYLTLMQESGLVLVHGTTVLIQSPQKTTGKQHSGLQNLVYFTYIKHHNISQ